MAQPHTFGWKQRDLPGFIGHAGPLWTRRDGEAWRYGLLLEAKHLNPVGRVHGGVLMTLIDHAISTSAWEANERSPCVTLQMDCHFFSSVLQGQFAEARTTINRQTGSLIFVRADLLVDERPVFSAQAILKRLSKESV